MTLLTAQAAAGAIRKAAGFNDTSKWAKSKATGTSNAILAPDGRMTGMKLVEDSTSGNHGITRSYTFATGKNTIIENWFKKGERTWVIFGVSYGAAFFDINNGVVGVATPNTKATIEDKGNGWYKCSVGFVGNGAADSLMILTSSGNGTDSYAGNGTSGIYVWDRGFKIREGVLSTPIFADSFEVYDNFSNWRTVEANTGAITVTTERSRKGNKAMKVVLNATDADVSNSKRAELTLPDEPSVITKRWYGFSIFLPTSYIVDPCEEIVAQWHGNPDLGLGEPYRHPPVALFTRNGRWELIVRYSPDAVSNNGTLLGGEIVDLGAYSTNVWTDWVFEMSRTYLDDGTGYIKIYRNGILIYTHNGPNNYNDATGNYFKLGIYKYGWKDGYVTTTSSRTLYFDEVRVSDEYASYADVAPKQRSIIADFIANVKADGGTVQEDMLTSEYNRLPAKVKTDGTWALIPGAYKAGTIYAMNPQTGGIIPITYTGGNVSMYVDSTGKLVQAQTNVPRLLYEFDTGECRGYLFEKSRTNLLLYSNDFNNAAWTKTNCTIAASPIVAPDGNMSATRVSGTGTYSLGQAVSTTVFTNSNFIGTAYIRIPSGSVSVDLGVNNAVTNFNTPDVWRRIKCGWSSTANGTSVTFNVTTNDAPYFDICFCQLEDGLVSSSYIPTTSATVTRAAQTIGTGDIFSADTNIFMELTYSKNPGTDTRLFYRGNSSGRIWYDNQADINTSQFKAYDGTGSRTSPVEVPAMQYSQAALQWLATPQTPTFRLSRNSILSSVTSFDGLFGTAGGGLVLVNDATFTPQLFVKAMAIIPGALTTGDLQALTT